MRSYKASSDSVTKTYEIFSGTILCIFMSGLEYSSCPDHICEKIGLTGIVAGLIIVRIYNDLDGLCMHFRSSVRRLVWIFSHQSSNDRAYLCSKDVRRLVWITIVV